MHRFDQVLSERPPHLQCLRTRSIEGEGERVSALCAVGQ